MLGADHDMGDLYDAAMQTIFQKRGFQAGCIAIAAAVAITVYAASADWSPKGFLPGTAQDIHEYQSPVVGITSDYWYLLKARVTEEEFLRFVKRLKLVPLEDTNPRREMYRWTGYGNEEWWFALETLRGTYHDPRSKYSSIVLAKYEGGHLYYVQSHGL
jgi:hypothetical protein